MSKSIMGKAEDEQKSQDSLARLTTSEFRELLPHLDLHEVLVTEILKNDKWMHLINVFYKPMSEKSVQCHVCRAKVTYTNVVEHIKGQRHTQGLKNIKQFFNPIYTYSKEATELMNGSRKATEKELKEAIEEANKDLAKRTNVAAHFAKIILNSMNNKLKKGLNEGEVKMLKKLVLETKPQNPANIFAQVNLPLLTLLKVEFRAKEDTDWEPIITTSNPHPNSRFECKLCKIMCGGVITVNAHFAGFNHKKLQLEAAGIRCKMYPYLTKNCVYQYDQNFSFTISPHAKSFFKAELDQLKTQEATANADDDVVEVIDDDDDETSKENSNINKAPADIKDRALALHRQGRKQPLIEDEKLSTMLKEAESQRVMSAGIATADDAAGNTNDFPNSSALVGVEYVICVNRVEYECVLCEFCGVETRMAEHLTSYAHRLKYLELHYPDTMEGYKNRMGSMPYKNFIRVMGLVLERVAAALESHHGYGAVRHVTKADYNKMRPRIVKELYALPHASQKWGPSFSTVCSVDLLDRFKRDPNMQAKAFVKSRKGERFIKLSPKDYNECNAAERKGRPLDLPNEPARRAVRRSHSRERSRSPRSRRHHDAPVVQHRNDPMSRESIWKAYRREVSKAASEIERYYMEYRLQPESHPMYNQEWNRFWKSRKEELIALNIDHRSYNFQPEWVNYFEKRIEYFFGEALHQSQVEIRRRMNIPLDAEEDTPTAPRHFSGGRDYRDADDGVTAGSGVHYEPRDKRSRMEAPSAHWQGPSVGGIPPTAGDMMYGGGGNVGNIVEAPLPPTIVDTKPNVIHVLRLLTAFEDHLGSLGGKVMDLLSKALTLEKRYGDDFVGLESNLLNASNCSLIETSAEKLKGILFAGLLDENKEQSFTRVVNATDKLLRHAEQMGYRNLEEEVALVTGVNDVVRGAESDSGRGRSNGGGGGVGGGIEQASTNDLQKLLSVLQSRKSGSNNAPTQKSLSDTLMELISGGGGGDGGSGSAGVDVDSSNQNAAKLHARNDYDEPGSAGVVGRKRDREISSDRGSGFDNSYSNPYVKNNNNQPRMERSNERMHSNSERQNTNERNNPNARIMNRMQSNQQQQQLKQHSGGNSYQQSYDDQPMYTNNRSSNLPPLMAGLMNFDTKLNHGFSSSGGGQGNSSLGYNKGGMGGGSSSFKNNYTTNQQQQGYNSDSGNNMNNQQISNKQMMGQNVGGGGARMNNSMQNRSNNAGSGYRNHNQNYDNYSNDNSQDFEPMDSLSSSMNPTAPNNGGGGGGGSNYSGTGGNFGNSENWGRFNTGNQQQNQRGSWQQRPQQQQQQSQYAGGRRGGFN